MLPSFCVETVTRKRAPLVSERGGKYRNWSAATSKSISGCSVQPGSTSADRDAREEASETWTLYAPPGADVKKGDRVVTSAGTFEVNGIPYNWLSASGQLDHMVCPLVRWEG